MAKITLSDVNSGYNLSAINENFQALEDELNNKVLYRNNPEGGPNACSSDLDLNGNSLLNVGGLTVDGDDIVALANEAIDSAAAAAVSETNAAASETAAAASAAIIGDWKYIGPWAPSTSYAVNNVVSYSGSTYICTTAHTSTGSFEAGNWDVLAQQGAAGAGTGDMLGANNLSELTNTSIARTNIGLGSVNNTSDANKPVSTATQTALNLKANLASPTLTGTPTAPTQSAGDNSTKLSTTAYVDGAISTHEGAADPHPDYATETYVDSLNAAATLLWSGSATTSGPHTISGDFTDYRFVIAVGHDQVWVSNEVKADILPMALFITGARPTPVTAYANGVRLTVSIYYVSDTSFSIINGGGSIFPITHVYGVK